MPRRHVLVFRSKFLPLHSSLFPSFPSSSLPGAVEGELQCPFQPSEIGFINLTGVTLEEARATTGNTLLDTAAAFLEKLLQDGGNVTQDGDTLEALSQISTELQKRNEELASCRTNRLWLQYMNMDEILQHSIKAERTGNFLLHLEYIKKCCLTLRLQDSIITCNLTGCIYSRCWSRRRAVPGIHEWPSQHQT